MTQKGYAHYAILADRTGSTGAMTDPGRTRAKDFTDGIRGLVTDQVQADGKTTISLVEFMSTAWLGGSGKGTHLDRTLWFAAGKDAVKALERWTLKPYGNTPLLDAMGTVITDTGAELEKLPEDKRPERVFFVVATDGEENCSTEYTKQQINDMVTHQADAYKWDFIFIGADIDAFDEAGAVGVAAASTLQTNSASSASLASAYAGTSKGMTRSRAGGQSVSFTDEEREAANQKGSK